MTGTVTASEWADVNRQRAGELFVLSMWVQGQMSDLLIFAERPDLIAPVRRKARDNARGVRPPAVRRLAT